MADFHFPDEQEATRYVLGELTPAERCEFETRLAHSPQLRELVDELEHGTLALAMASPPKSPPHQVWRQIQQALEAEQKPKYAGRNFWFAWWRHGWAAAAICLIGWVLYAIWTHQAVPANDPLLHVVAEQAPQPNSIPFNPSPDRTVPDISPVASEVDSTAKAAQPETIQINALVWQLADLTNRMTQLSQMVTQQQAFLSDSNRLKFFQLTPPSGDFGATEPQVSPNLQRALFLAMARELGWTPPGGSTATTAEKNTAAPLNSAQTNHAGVDFVDLRPETNFVNTTARETDTVQEPIDTPEQPVLASALSNPVPGFISGTNAVLAFDSSIVPTGSLLSFWTTTPAGQMRPLGRTLMGVDPLVVTVPFATTSWQNGNVTVLAGSAHGPSSVLGHFSMERILGH